jgi:hypothetical protein
LHAGQIYSIDFCYSGRPVSIGRFGGITFESDPAGRPWIYTACEGFSASIWLPRTANGTMERCAQLNRDDYDFGMQLY